jgi:hypothetical protein
MSLITGCERVWISKLNQHRYWSDVKHCR